ncbi:MAG: MBL fold metallo-hydrolase, partial [Wenzhouxiangellaceae bacterium]
MRVFLGKPTLMMATVLAASVMALPAAAAMSCGQQPLALQVLGSGGPMADGDRAGSGYVVWRDGQAKVLIDAGGGVFLRFGQAGASLDTLEHVAITHFHTDHVADLTALLKGAAFSERRAPLPISGPNGNRRFPSLEHFLQAQFAADGGAFAYLGGLLEDNGDMFRLQPITVAAERRDTVEVHRGEDLVIEAIGIPHGPVPTLAYRIEVDDRSLVISGDQNLGDGSFIEFARGADVLVMPFAIPEGAGPAAANLHARPSAIGRAAASADVDHLVL